MVAGDCYIITNLVHDIDDVFTFGKSTNGIALDCVAVINKDYGFALFFKGVFYGCNACIAKVAGNTAVNVVGVKNNNFAGEFKAGFFAFNRLFEFSCRFCGTAGKNKHKSHQKCENFAHDKCPPLSFSFHFRVFTQISLYDKRMFFSISF